MRKMYASMIVLIWYIGGRISDYLTYSRHLVIWCTACFGEYFCC